MARPPGGEARDWFLVLHVSRVGARVVWPLRPQETGPADCCVH